jgi:hypothetical protein
MNASSGRLSRVPFTVAKLSLLKDKQGQGCRPVGREPFVFLHQPELARQALGEPRGHGQFDFRHNHSDWLKRASEARYQLLSARRFFGVNPRHRHNLTAQRHGSIWRSKPQTDQVQTDQEIFSRPRLTNFAIRALATRNRRCDLHRQLGCSRPSEQFEPTLTFEHHSRIGYLLFQLLASSNAVSNFFRNPCSKS